MEPCLLCGGLGLLSFPGKRERGLQRYQRYLGGAIQSHRNSDRADAGIGVKRERTNLVGPHYIFFPHCRQVERRKQRDPDLASVRVPGELQVYWEFRRLIRKIGFVRQQDNGFASGNAAQSFCKVSRSAEHVIHAGEPEASAIALNRGRLVFQYLDADGSECVGYVHRVGIEIMVPHDCPQAVRSGHLAKDVSAWFGGQCRFCLVSEQRHGNKIPSQHDQVGMETVDQRTRRMQRVHRTIRVVVKVAQESDGETVKPFGPARQREILVHDARAIWFQQE